MPFTNLIAQTARGFVMGAADVVPGVSGGTVALVFGIYERLLDNIRAGAAVLGDLARRDGRAALRSLRSVDWPWLVALLVGILAAVVALASIIEGLLEDHPIRMAGLFFGLIAGSVLVAARLVRAPEPRVYALVGLFAVATFLLLGLRGDTHADDAELVTEPLWAFFLAGALAICAMILPGVSGSFLLVMVGMYGEVLGAVNDRDLAPLLVLVAGCVLGLAAFSSLLSWLLHHHHDLVIGAMIGLMVGSLRVLWPWPAGTDTTRLEHPSGDVVVPVLLAIGGFAVVALVDRFGSRRTPAPALEPAAAPRPRA